MLSWYSTPGQNMYARFFLFFAFLSTIPCLWSFLRWLWNEIHLKLAGWRALCPSVLSRRVLLAAVTFISESHDEYQLGKSTAVVWAPDRFDNLWASRNGDKQDDYIQIRYIPLKSKLNWTVMVVWSDFDSLYTAGQSTYLLQNDGYVHTTASDI